MLVVGASLLALGLGNTAMGLFKLTDYSARMQAAVASGGESARKPAQGTVSILDPSTDAQLLYESAYLKFEYYHVVLRGGLMLLTLGSLLIGGAVIRKFIAWNRGQRGAFALPQS